MVNAVVVLLVINIVEEYSIFSDIILLNFLIVLFIDMIQNK